MTRARVRKTQEVLAITSAVGAEDLERLRTGLKSALASTSMAFTVDISRAETLDGPCLAALISATTSMATAERHLNLIVHPDISRSLSEWRLDSILDYTETQPAPKPASSKGT